MVALSTHADIALEGAEIVQMGEFAPSAEQVMGIWI
jgi:hypothetical protein